VSVRLSGLRAEHPLEVERQPEPEPRPLHRPAAAGAAGVADGAQDGARLEAEGEPEGGREIGLEGDEPAGARGPRLALAGLALDAGGVGEVILALNATVEGQTTAHYIMDQLTGLKAKVSRLAHGVPVGGELDYLDEGTLSAAIRQRTAF